MKRCASPARRSGTQDSRSLSRGDDGEVDVGLRDLVDVVGPGVQRDVQDHLDHLRIVVTGEQAGFQAGAAQQLARARGGELADDGVELLPDAGLGLAEIEGIASRGGAVHVVVQLVAVPHEHRLPNARAHNSRNVHAAALIDRHRFCRKRRRGK